MSIEYCVLDRSIISSDLSGALFKDDSFIGVALTLMKLIKSDVISETNFYYIAIRVIKIFIGPPNFCLPFGMNGLKQLY